MSLMNMITVTMLVIWSVRDVRKRAIPAWWLAAGGIFALAVAGHRLLVGETGAWGLLMAISPGVFLMALSIITARQIGIGDGICVVIVGLLLGTPGIWMALMAALLLSSGYALFLLVIRHVSRGSVIPWFPFVAAGTMLTMAMEVWS